MSRKDELLTQCTMGVGCNEYGICYADAHGQPDFCPLRALAATEQ